MANLWIESHTSLRAHKKLKPLCDELKISRAQAIGHLHMLWWWTLENRGNGDLSSLFDRDIADACDWHLDPKKLIKALKSSGWLTKDMWINDWSDYAGRIMAMRASNRDRQQKFRANNRDSNGDKNVTSHENNGATRPNLTKPNHNGLLFQRPQEILIKRLFAERLHHEVDSEVNQAEYDRLVKMIQSDPKIKDPMAVAIYRATHG